MVPAENPFEGITRDRKVRVTIRERLPVRGSGARIACAETDTTTFSSGGRPGAEADKLDLARRELAKGTGICKTTKPTGLGTGRIHKLGRQMEGDDMLCKRHGSAAAN